MEENWQSERVQLRFAGSTGVGVTVTLVAVASSSCCHKSFAEWLPFTTSYVWNKYLHCNGMRNRKVLVSEREVLILEGSLHRSEAEKTCFVKGLLTCTKSEATLLPTSENTVVPHPP